MDDTGRPTPAQAVWRWSRERPQAVAVVDGGQPYTWLQLATHVAQCHAFLAEAGLRPGQLVALHCPNRTLNLMLLLAAEAMGAVHASLANGEDVPDHPVVRHAELICSVGPATALAGDPRVRWLDAAWLEATLERPLGPAGLAVLGAASPAESGVRVGWTSGTTGQPKFMLNTRGQLNAILAAADAAYLSQAGGRLTNLCFNGPTVRSVYLRVIRALLGGNRVVFAEDAGVLAMLGPLELVHATLLPRDAERLARLCLAQGRFLNLYYIDVAGSMLLPALHGLLQRTLSHRIYNGYASNETNVIGMTQLDGTVLLAPGCEAMVVDAAGQPVPPGAVGMVRVRSPSVVTGYLWNPALHERHFKDGWFLMNDLGALVAPGVLRLLGRADDMLNIGGLKLAPYPLEARLKQLPGVTDALLLLRDSAAAVGELLVVVERPHPGDDTALAAQVQAVMLREVPGFVLHFATDLPRTATGKPRREEVSRRLAAGEAL